MLLVTVSALVGGTLGRERTVLPLLVGQVFHLDLYTSALTYIPAFGVAKAGELLRRRPRCLRAVSMADCKGFCGLEPPDALRRGRPGYAPRDRLSRR